MSSRSSGRTAKKKELSNEDLRDLEHELSLPSAKGSSRVRSSKKTGKKKKKTTKVTRPPPLKRVLDADELEELEQQVVGGNDDDAAIEIAPAAKHDDDDDDDDDGGGGGGGNDTNGDGGDDRDDGDGDGGTDVVVDVDVRIDEDADDDAAPAAIAKKKKKKSKRKGNDTTDGGGGSELGDDGTSTAESSLSTANIRKTNTDSFIQVAVRFKPRNAGNSNASTRRDDVADDDDDEKAADDEESKRWSMHVIEPNRVDIEYTDRFDRSNARLFVCDRVFHAQHDQSAVAADLGADDMAARFALGQDVTVLAFGCTGTGKSYALFGGGDGDGGGDAAAAANRDLLGRQRGMAPRVAKEAFDLMEADPGIESAILAVSVLQVYRGAVTDCLKPGVRAPLKVKESMMDGVVRVKGAQYVTVDSPVKFSELVANALRRRRAEQPTRVIERSHVVVKLLCAATLANGDGDERRSELTFVDLCGSERIDETREITEDDVLDAKAAGESLSALGNVLLALADRKRSFMPYRKTPLTHLLSKPLGADAAITVVVTCATGKDDLQETMASLEFASKVCKYREETRAPDLTERLSVRSKIDAFMLASSGGGGVGGAAAVNMFGGFGDDTARTAATTYVDGNGNVIALNGGINGINGINGVGGADSTAVTGRDTMRSYRGKKHYLGDPEEFLQRIKVDEKKARMERASWAPSVWEWEPRVTAVIVLLLLVVFGVVEYFALRQLNVATRECNVFHVCARGDECVHGFCVQTTIQELSFGAFDETAAAAGPTVVTGAAFDDTTLKGTTTMEVVATAYTANKASYRVRFDPDHVPHTLSACTILHAEYQDRSYMRRYLSHKLFSRTTGVPVPLVRYVQLRYPAHKVQLYVATWCTDTDYLAAYSLDASTPSLFEYAPPDASVTAIAASGANRTFCAYTPLPDTGDYTYANFFKSLAAPAMSSSAVSSARTDIKAWVSDCLTADYSALRLVDSVAHFFTVDAPPAPDIVLPFNSNVTVRLPSITAAADMFHVRVRVVPDPDSRLRVVYVATNATSLALTTTNLLAAQSSGASLTSAVLVADASARPGTFKMVFKVIYESAHGNTHRDDVVSWLVVGGEDHRGDPDYVLPTQQFTYEQGVAEANARYRARCLRSTFNTRGLVEYLSVRALAQNTDDAYRHHALYAPASSSSSSASPYSLLPMQWSRTFGCTDEACAVTSATVSYKRDATIDGNATADLWPCTTAHNQILTLGLSDGGMHSCVKKRVCALIDDETWTRGVREALSKIVAVIKRAVDVDTADNVDSAETFDTEVGSVRDFLAARATALSAEFQCHVPPPYACELGDTEYRMGYTAGVAILAVLVAIVAHFWLFWYPSQRDARAMGMAWAFIVLVSVSVVLAALASDTTSVFYDSSMSQMHFEQVLYLVALAILGLQAPLWLRMGLSRAEPEPPITNDADDADAAAAAADKLRQQQGRGATAADIGSSQFAIDDGMFDIDELDIGDLEDQRDDDGTTTVDAADKLRRRVPWSRPPPVSEWWYAHVDKVAVGLLVAYAVCIVAYLVFMGISEEHRRRALSLRAFLVVVATVTMIVCCHATGAICKWAALYRFVGMSGGDLDMVFADRAEYEWSDEYLTETYKLRTIHTIDVLARNGVHLVTSVVGVAGAYLAGMAYLSVNVHAIVVFGALLAVAHLAVYASAYKRSNLWTWIVYGAVAETLEGERARTIDAMRMLVDTSIAPVAAVFSFGFLAFFTGTDLVAVGVTVMAPYAIGSNVGECVGLFVRLRPFQVRGMRRPADIAHVGANAMATYIVLCITYASASARPAWYGVGLVAALIGVVVSVLVPRIMGRGVCIVLCELVFVLIFAAASPTP